MSRLYGHCYTVQPFLFSCLRITKELAEGAVSASMRRRPLAAGSDCLYGRRHFRHGLG